MNKDLVTAREIWEALRGFSTDVKSGKSPSADTIHWLASAIERCKEDDATQLLRELGLIVMGRPRIVNPKTVSSRVAKLVASGSSIMAACKQAANEFGCSTNTANNLYKAADGAKADGRRRLA